MNKLSQPEKPDLIEVQRVRNGYMISVIGARHEQHLHTTGMPYIATNVGTACEVVEDLLTGNPVVRVDYGSTVD